ncbi:MAG: hypothetical protein R8M45_07275 [Ghiorsea sp.]
MMTKKVRNLHENDVVAQRLFENITEVIDTSTKGSSITVVSVVGVLEMVKHRMISTCYSDEVME